MKAFGRTFTALALCVTIVACSTASLRRDQIQGNFESNIKNLDLNNSFAFYHGADEFYFSRVLLFDGEYKCRFFVGFKNGQFSYAFPEARLAELSEIYYDKKTLEKKKELALQKIQAFEVEQQKCSKESAERDNTAGDYVEAALYLLVLAPAIPFGIAFGADVWVKGIKDSILEGKLDRIRLGEDFDQVKKRIGKEFTKKQISHYEYHYLDYGSSQRIVMVFENNRLTGIIRGYQDLKEHK